MPIGSSNQSVQPTGGSRFAQPVFGRQRRLPPVTDAWRYATPHEAMKILMFAFLCAFGLYASGAEQPKAAAPIVIEVSDVVRDWDLVRVHKVQTNALVTFFFRTWPTTEMESSVTKAIRTKTLIRVIEATN